jgi:ubiquitin-protein ligase
LCGTCHSFIFPNFQHEEPIFVTETGDDSDSGNDEPHNKEDEQEEDGESEIDDDPNYVDRPRPTAPRNVNQYLELLSQPQNEPNDSQQKICALPVEVLLSIFAYLDDLSLCNVSEVCKQWRKILEEYTPQRMWKKYTKERWPLFQQIASVSNWLHMYCALMNSCFCRTCLIQMALKTPLRGIYNPIRANRLRGDIRSLGSDATEGIFAVPLDNQLSHWQASILGPAGSPYEGGKFFLYIIIPFSYPMLPPQVRFLTKILHPNVSRHGDVGIDSIRDNWSVALNISKLLLSVQSLLTDPFTTVRRSVLGL